MAVERSPKEAGLRLPGPAKGPIVARITLSTLPNEGHHCLPAGLIGNLPVAGHDALEAGFCRLASRGTVYLRCGFVYDLSGSLGYPVSEVSGMTAAKVHVC